MLSATPDLSSMHPINPPFHPGAMDRCEWGGDAGAGNERGMLAPPRSVFHSEVWTCVGRKVWMDRCSHTERGMQATPGVCGMDRCGYKGQVRPHNARDALSAWCQWCGKIIIRIKRGLRKRPLIAEARGQLPEVSGVDRCGYVRQSQLFLIQSFPRVSCALHTQHQH